MLPLGVTIDPVTGAIHPQTGAYKKFLSECRGLYQDKAATDAMLEAHGDVLVYTVAEYREPGADLFFGTTTMYPGRVGDEFFMTRGHFHARRDRGEIYYTQSGQGLLLLQSRAGEVCAVDMLPGSCAHIPPDWAHRSINTGDQPLVFYWCLSQDAGNDYAEILTKGMAERVVWRDGDVARVPA